MKTNSLPFNISIMDLSNRRIKQLNKVTAPDITEASSGEFHPAGLYSNLIFGPPGSEQRNEQRAYIDLKLKIIHPKLLKELFALKGLYGSIMSGSEYAIFDEKLKDFVRSDAISGETGFHYFVTNLPKIVFPRNKSGQRDLRIELIEKYREIMFMDKLIVLPAGLRDLETSSNGRPVEHEINKLYRNVLSATNTFNSSMIGKVGPELDISAWRIQKNVLEVYDYLETMLKGKRGFLQKRWGSRKVFGSTRNVISSMDLSSDSYDSPRTPELNTTHVGIHQFIKSCVPVISNALVVDLISDIYNDPDSEVELIDPKTKKLVSSRLSQKTRDKWSTIDGLEDLMNGFEQPDVRHRPVTLDGRYLAWVYNDGEFMRVFKDLAEFPEHLSKDNVAPITWAELFYRAAYQSRNKVAAFITRYPVTSTGSVYATRPYVKSTQTSRILKSLGDDWIADGELFPEWPTNGDPFFDTISPHSLMLGNLGADKSLSA